MLAHKWTASLQETLVAKASGEEHCSVAEGPGSIGRDEKGC